MPAKNLHRIDEERTYSHIYNKGVEKRIIFADSHDYDVFLGYLRDYLSPLADPESAKREFRVNGRVYRGTPHQPKNYFGKVELVAYSLKPNSFHLLLHQKTKGSLENFIRSLCTRYSMYFNKKYKRSGALFEGPYKSIQIEDELSLLLLTHYLHHFEGHSSYPEYLGSKANSWVKPEVVQSYFDKVRTDLFKGTHSYKDFVERYDLSQKEQESLNGIILESGSSGHLERTVLTRDVAASNLKPLSRVPEFVGITVVFLLLLALGVRNIEVSTAKSSSHPVTLGASDTPKLEQVKVEDIKPKAMVTIKIDDGAASVNIRKEPTVHSEKIGEARDGDSFEFVSQTDPKWYEVKLADGSTGFISATYIVEENK